MRRLLLFGVIAALLSVVGAASTRPATMPRLYLTYAVALGGAGERGGLCLARPDGTARTRLTAGPGDRSPSWSPDGGNVVFSRRLAGQSGSRIVVADARGHVVRRFGSGVFNSDPAWSADGRRIAYSAREGGSSRIVVANAQGQAIARLPTRAAFAGRPSWSPDGKRIAYVAQLDTDAEPEGGLTRIVVVAPDGTGRRIFATRADDPAWSPDGSKIAYVALSTRFADTGDIAVADVDGGNRRRLTDTRAPETRPAWSPNGREVAFARGSGPESTIVVVDRDGGNARVVVRSSAYGALDPAWRPRAPLPAARRGACP